MHMTASLTAQHSMQSWIALWQNCNDCKHESQLLGPVRTYTGFPCLELV